MIDFDSLLEKIIQIYAKENILYIALTNKTSNFAYYRLEAASSAYFVRFSADPIILRVERAALDLCQKKQLPTPRVIAQEKFILDHSPLYASIQLAIGKPFQSTNYNIFEYNNLLASYAKHLLKLHSISLEGYGTLTSKLYGLRGSWAKFIRSGLEEQLANLEKNGLIKSSYVKKINRVLDIPLPFKGSLLHGHLSTGIILTNDLTISSISDFSQPLSGDPNYDLAGFLLYEGFDRAERLIRAYSSFGGKIEWDSEIFLKTALKRVIKSLDSAIKQNETKKIFQRKNILNQLLLRLQM